MAMRNIQFYIISCVIVCLFLVACSDQYKEDGNYSPSVTLHYLRPSKSNLSTSADENYLNIQIESVSTTWEFTNTQSWFSISPNRGDISTSVSMHVKENFSADTSRVAMFYLQSATPEWQYKKTMSISQEAAIPSVSVSRNNVDFGGSSASQTVKITSNCTWEAKTSEDWISLKVDKDNNELTIAVTSNPKSNYRTGNIIVSYKSGNRNITVKQAPSQITTSDATLSLSNVASKVTIELNAESDWTAQVSDSWVSLNPNKGSAGKKSVEISVLPNETVNERTAYVSFLTAGNQKAQIEIVQEGLYLQTDITSLNFRSKGETKIVNVYSNTDWKITSFPEWMTVSVSKGSGGNAELEVTAEGNQSLTPRDGTIVIQKTGLDLKTFISVEQDAMTLNVDAQKLSFSHKAEETNIDLTADFPWYSSVSDTWITTNPTQGTGDATIKISVTENNSYNERVGTILYSMSEATQSVQVEQDAKFFTIDAKPFNFTSKGGVVTISFATNEKWTARITDAASWAKLSAYSGEGSADLILTVADNPSVNKRSTQLIIETPIGQALCVPITQDARYFTVDTQTLTFFAKGGSADVTIDTDGTIDVSDSADWLHVNIDASVVKVTADPNDSQNNRQCTLVISLSDLTDGEMSVSIPVYQVGEGGTFSWEDYGDETNWDVNSYSGLTISIVDYQVDKNWNQEQRSSFTVSKTEYDDDLNWNN